MFRKLYGTDGIRGLYKEKITPELAFEIGKAISIVFERKNEINNIIIGKDTRLVCDTLESALVAGINSMGANAIRLGIVPTAFVPFSIKNEKANAGIMITASHNSKEYIGFKFFNGNGYKIADEQEAHIEYILANPMDYSYSSYDRVGRTFQKCESKQKYLKYIKSILKINKDIRSVAIDCSYGSISTFIKNIFCDVNCEIHILNDTYNGINVNEGCGSENTGFLKKYVLDNKVDIGFAFDGDGDRVRMVDSSGEVVDGEKVLFFLANKLDISTVVTSNISNLGLVHSLKFCDIESLITDVGEKNIVVELLKNNLTFGGEKNGHIIFLDRSTTSDGLLSMAVILSLMESRTINSECENYIPFYQTNINIKLSDDKANEIINDKAFKRTIEVCESLLNESGRLMVRKSGTENILRVLVEGYNMVLVENIKEEINKAIEKI